MSEFEGSAAFLLFALYFEELERSREGASVDSDKYEALVSRILPLIYRCLDAIEKFEPLTLITNLDSFAKAALSTLLT